MVESNGPKINTALWVMTGLSFGFISLRFYCKGVYTRKLRTDDAILLISWLFSLVYAVMITMSVRFGMGRHKWEIDPEDVVDMNKYLFIGEFFTLIAIPTSKTSFAVTLLRLVTRGWEKSFIWFVIITMNVAMWMCGILLLVQCQPIDRNWDKKTPGTCWDSKVQDQYSIFAGVYSAFLDFVLAIFPCLIIWKLQMSVREKFGVIFAMSLGFLAGIAAAVKTSFLPGVGKFDDITFQIDDLLIWSHVETSVTIMAASIPFFRVLLRQMTSNRSKPAYIQSYRLESYGNEIVSTARHSRRLTIQELEARGDDMSERSILGATLPIQGTTILKSSEVRVEFSEAKDRNGFAMSGHGGKM